MVVQMKLKAKYREVTHGHHKAVGDHNGKASKRKGGARVYVRDDHVLLMRPSGKTGMVHGQAARNLLGR